MKSRSAIKLQKGRIAEKNKIGRQAEMKNKSRKQKKNKNKQKKRRKVENCICRKADK